MFKNKSAATMLCVFSLIGNVLLISWILNSSSENVSSKRERVAFADRSAKLAIELQLKQNAYMYGERTAQDPLLKQFGTLIADEVPTLRSHSLLLLTRYGNADRKEIEAILKSRLTEEKHPEVFNNLIYAVVQLDPTYLPTIKRIVETSISDPTLKVVFISEYEGLKSLAE